MQTISSGRCAARGAGETVHDRSRRVRRTIRRAGARRTGSFTGRRHRLWAGGLATAVVAALIALVGLLIVRAVLRIALLAPKEAGAFGDGDTAVLCVAAAAAALAATGLVHLLLLATPRPLSYFAWIVGLLTAVAVVLPLLSGRSLAIALAQSVIHLVIGLAIGSLVAGAAAARVRVRRAPYDQRFAVE
jgi:hypothetical protein